MGSTSYILGISAFYHDSAACLLRDGEIIAAAQEERFTRKKGDAALPTNAIDYCLGTAGIEASDLAYVGFYDKPLLKFERILETYLGVVPRGLRSFLMAGPLWIKDKLYMDRQLRQALGYDGEILYAEHHESHAASAFFASPFEEAAILTMDGVGEWATASIGVGRGNDVELLEELHWPDSLGLLYSAFTYYTGFKVNSGEYKVMGLAPYGEPKYVDTILDELVDLNEDGSFVLDQKYFNYLTGLTMTNGAFDQLFGGPPRKPESPSARWTWPPPFSTSARRSCCGWPAPLTGKRVCPTCAWLEASLSTAWGTAGSCGRDLSRTYGSSPLPGTPGARSGWPSSSGIATAASLVT
jgi:carbamoyltransferase